MKFVIPVLVTFVALLEAQAQTNDTTTDSKLVEKTAQADDVSIECHGYVANGFEDKTGLVETQTISLKKSEETKDAATYSARVRLLANDKKHAFRVRIELYKEGSQFKNLYMLGQFERKEADGSVKVLALADGSGKMRTTDWAGDILDRPVAFGAIRVTNPEIATLLANSKENPDFGIESGVLPAKSAHSLVEKIVPKGLAKSASLNCIFLAPSE